MPSTLRSISSLGRKPLSTFPTESSRLAFPPPAAARAAARSDTWPSWSGLKDPGSSTLALVDPACTSPAANSTIDTRPERSSFSAEAASSLRHLAISSFPPCAAPLRFKGISELSTSQCSARALMTRRLATSSSSHRSRCPLTSWTCRTLMPLEECTATRISWGPLLGKEVTRLLLHPTPKTLDPGSAMRTARAYAAPARSITHRSLTYFSGSLPRRSTIASLL
mmetsp:Transcript_8464/g.27648  ORF Transcript_8464/g.27648 Transcript_8464/m.27648 type:complete len:224 (-) Transcript_8464:311-982(-)